jgi:hypothetical protein
MGLEQRRFEATAMRCAYVDELFLAREKARQVKEYSKYKIVISSSIVPAYFPRGKTTKG